MLRSVGLGNMYCNLNSRLTKYGEKNILGNLRTFRVLPVLFLLLGIFANSVMAETCFCGEACSHDFKNNVKKKVNFPFHNHCVGSHCKSCNFEDGQTLKARNSSSPDGNLKLLDTTLLIFTLSAYHLDNHIIWGFTSDIYAFKKARSLPLFLNNCSLLC